MYFNCKEMYCPMLAPLLLNGPFGQVTELHNNGESKFIMTEVAHQLGGVSLCGSAESLLTSIAYWGPQTYSENNGVLRRGQMLCFGNMHWAADPSEWNGGEITRIENEYFACNLFASAIAIKENPVSRVRTLKELSRLKIRQHLVGSVAELQIPIKLQQYIALVEEFELCKNIEIQLQLVKF